MTEQELRFCTECGARIPVRPFCIQCGATLAPLSSSAQTPAQTPAPTPAPTPGPPAAPPTEQPADQPADQPYEYLFTPPPARPEPDPFSTAPFSPAPVPPPGPFPGDGLSRPSTRRSGGRGRAVLVVVATLVLLGGAAAGAWLLLSDDPEPTAQDASSRSSTPSTEDSGSPSEAPTTSESAVEPSTPPATPQATVRCWDGSRSADKASCPALTGDSALRWVFPSIDRFGGCRLGASGDPLGVATQFVCEVDSNGFDATVYYREWATSADAESFYRDKFGVDALPIYGPDGTLVFHQWEDRATGDAVRLFVRVPFSASVNVASGAPVEVLRNPSAVNYVHAQKLP